MISAANRLDLTRRHIVCRTGRFCREVLAVDGEFREQSLFAIEDAVFDMGVALLEGRCEGRLGAAAYGGRGLV